MSILSTKTLDRQCLIDAADVLFTGDQVIELRAINAAGGVRWGRYRDRDKLADAATELQRRGFSAYWTINEFRSDIDVSEKWQSGRGAAADVDIVHRRWLLIDLDAVRSKGKAATDAQLQDVYGKSYVIVKHLTAQGWPQPTLQTETGNGLHLFYRCDFEADARTAFAVERWLQDVSQQFSDADVNVDVTVHNPARIARIPGSLNLKATPARRVEIIKADADAAAVPWSLLEPFAAQFVEQPVSGGNGNNGFDLAEWLRAVNAPLRHQSPKLMSDGSRLWEFTHDPVSGRTDDTTSYVVQHIDGGIGAGSHHQSPESQWGWAELKQALDPGFTLAGLDATPAPAATVTTATAVPDFGPLRPLPAAYAPVQPVTHDMLPQRLSDYLFDISDRMSAPVEFAAASAMVVLGSVVGNRVGCFPKLHDDWHEFPNLWGAVVAPPGHLKSPIINLLLTPLRQLEEQHQRYNEAASLEFEALATSVETERKALRGQQTAAFKSGDGYDRDTFSKLFEQLDRTLQEARPPVRSAFTTDSTVVALQVRLQDNPHGLLYWSDELSALLRDIYRKDADRIKDFLLEAWSGKQPLKQDRLSRDSVYIERCCVSVFGGMTPATLEKPIRDADQFGGDGFIQRFGLLMIPDAPAYVPQDRKPDEAAAAWFCGVVLSLHQRAEQMQQAAVGGFAGIRFSPDAVDIFEMWRSAHLEILIRDETLPQSLRGHLAKYRKLVPAIALLLLHLFEERSDAISGDMVEQALRWAAVCESHARRAYGAALSAERSSARLLAKRILDRHIGWDTTGNAPVPFAVRDVYRNDWSGLDVDQAKAAVETLIDYGWASLETIRTGGRSAYRVIVNPNVYSTPGLLTETSLDPHRQN